MRFLISMQALASRATPVICTFALTLAHARRRWSRRRITATDRSIRSRRVRECTLTRNLCHALNVGHAGQIATSRQMDYAKYFAYAGLYFEVTAEGAACADLGVNPKTRSGGPRLPFGLAGRWCNVRLA